MASLREQVIVAVKALVEAAVPDATVRRNGDFPDRPEAGGLIIVRDGDPGDPIGVLLSPLAYTYAHAIQLEVVAPAGTEERSEVLDALLAAIGARIESDRTLGGLCEWLEPTAPDTDDINPASTQPVRWAALDVVATYTTHNPLT